jgi:transcriptional regulator with XRE-family HTH domain
LGQLGRNTRRHRALIAVLIEAREAAGMSQRDVARRLKKRAIFAHTVESGERMLSAVELPDYARALNLEPLQLFKRMLELERSGEPIPVRVDGRKRRKKRAHS